MPGPESKSIDDVRQYLQNIAAVPLLTRESEVELAKLFEDGEREILAALTNLTKGKKKSRGRRLVDTARAPLDRAQVRHLASQVKLLLDRVAGAEARLNLAAKSMGLNAAELR